MNLCPECRKTGAAKEIPVLYFLLFGMNSIHHSPFSLTFEGLTGSALVPGVIAAIQTFGDRINLHPHLHFLVTEGGVDAADVFLQIPLIDDSRLAEIFAREVLADLVRKELLSGEYF